MSYCEGSRDLSSRHRRRIMSKKTRQSEIGLKTLATELRQLADHLERGVIEVEGFSIAVGEPLFLKTKRKVKEERAYFTLSFKAPLSEASPPSAADTPRATTPKPSREAMPPAGKTMKKEIARLWKEVSGRINANAAPAPADRNKLLRLVEEYRLYTPASWSPEWERCGMAISRCLDAAGAADFATAQKLVAAINQETKSCHKLHK